MDLEKFIILTQEGSWYFWEMVRDDSQAVSRDAEEMDFEACGQFE